MLAHTHVLIMYVDREGMKLSVSWFSSVALQVLSSKY